MLHETCCHHCEQHDGVPEAAMNGCFRKFFADNPTILSTSTTSPASMGASTRFRRRRSLTA
jgi:hypothetical protein